MKEIDYKKELITFLKRHNAYCEWREMLFNSNFKDCVWLFFEIVPPHAYINIIIRDSYKVTHNMRLCHTEWLNFCVSQNSDLKDVVERFLHS